MKIQTITIEYQITRSRDYQSVRIGGAVTIQLADGEKPGEAFDNAESFLIRKCNSAADTALVQLLFGEKGV